ncbi:MAG: IMP dehydrogenase, partial [Bdellovibrionales bacterium]|nr:IMP dehydrogenase [Bdellovibrionales bacterium]
MATEIPQGLTYDDVLLIPQFSEVVPSEISTESFFAKGISLKVPVIAAAMDTVTEHKTAQVMAQLGGLGIIHKNMSIKSQAFEVEKVKKYESGMILDPITMHPDNRVADAMQLMQKYSISGVPITVDGKLVGILTNRDLRFETNMEQPISALMTHENLVTAEVGTNLEQAKVILHKHRIEKLPVVD